MISAAELRKIQAEKTVAVAEERAKIDAEFAVKFKTSCDKYYDVLMAEVKNCLELAKKSSKTSFILRRENLTKDLDGMKYTTFLNGFWDKTAKKFDDSIFTKNGIEKPLDRAAKELEPLGFKLENITDSSKSFNLFIRLSW